MLRKILLATLSGLALAAYIKRREIGYATLGAIATGEQTLRNKLNSIAQRYLISDDNPES